MRPGRMAVISSFQSGGLFAIIKYEKMSVLDWKTYLCGLYPSRPVKGEKQGGQEMKTKDRKIICNCCGKTLWEGDDESKTEIFTYPPDTGIWTRILKTLAKILPESQI